MTSDNRTGLGRILRRQRVTRELTLQQLSKMSGVSSSHLGRMERGERFPSAHILRKIAKPLGLAEGELLTLAGYLSPSTTVEGETRLGQLDPYVTMVLSQEPMDIQRAVVTIFNVMKSMAHSITRESGCDIGFVEYVPPKGAKGQKQATDCPIGLDNVHCQNCYFSRDGKCDYKKIMKEPNCQEHPPKG